MIFEHPMLPAELPLTETAVTNYPLRIILAVLKRAFVLSRRAASERKSQMEGCVRRDGEGREGEGRVAGRGEMLAGVDEAEGRWGKRGAEGDEM